MAFYINIYKGQLTAILRSWRFHDENHYPYAALPPVPVSRLIPRRKASPSITKENRTDTPPSAPRRPSPQLLNPLNYYTLHRSVSSGFVSQSSYSTHVRTHRSVYVYQSIDTRFVRVPPNPVESARHSAFFFFPIQRRTFHDEPSMFRRTTKVLPRLSTFNSFSYNIQSYYFSLTKLIFFIHATQE